MENKQNIVDFTVKLMKFQGSINGKQSPLIIKQKGHKIHFNNKLSEEEILPEKQFNNEEKKSKGRLSSCLIKSGLLYILRCPFEQK